MKKIERLGEYISEYSVRNKDNEDIQVYSVTNTNGFCTEYFDKDVASKDQTKYKIVPKGYFAYNPSRINVGSIDCQSVEDRVIVSPLYVVFKADERVDNNYLLHYLKSDIGKTYINELASGSVRANLKFSILQEFPFPMIPIEEQKEKMAVIAKIDESIACCDSIIEKLDLAVKSRFIEMFGDPVENEKGWEMIPLSELGTCKNGMNFASDEDGIEIAYLGVGDFKDNSRIDGVSGLSQISLNTMPSEEYLLKDEDIVFVRSNGSKELVGRCLAVYPGNEKLTFSGFCIRWRKNSDKVMTDFLLQVLKTENVRILMRGRGANIQNLNQQILGKLMIPVPNMALQQSFVEFVGAIDKSKLAVQEMKNKMEILKASVMQEYFC